MKSETFFKRYEYKYLISRSQMEVLVTYMDKYTIPAEFHKSQVLSLYYDTDDYRLIRRSLEKPLYKEKIRLRSYGVPDANTPVFLEIKKKFKHVVYKRRIELRECKALAFMRGEDIHKTGDASIDVSQHHVSANSTQIEKELAYARDFYGELSPKMMISSDRLSYVGKDDSSLRITFDIGITWRDYDLSLEKGVYGNPLLPEDTVLMEIKAPMAIPLWMVDFLDENNIRRRSFSKYGTAYEIKLREENRREVV